MNNDFKVNVEYSYNNEVNSNNKEWYNKDAREAHINIYKSGEHYISFHGLLTHSQVEHIIALIQDNIIQYKDIDKGYMFILDVIKNYEHINNKNDNVPLLGDNVFMKD